MTPNNLYVVAWKYLANRGAFLAYIEVGCDILSAYHYQKPGLLSFTGAKQLRYPVVKGSLSMSLCSKSGSRIIPTVRG
jgi:hypothetical protein